MVLVLNTNNAHSARNGHLTCSTAAVLDPTLCWLPAILLSVVQPWLSLPRPPSLTLPRLVSHAASPTARPSHLRVTHNATDDHLVHHNRLPMQQAASRHLALCAVTAPNAAHPTQLSKASLSPSQATAK